MDTSGREPQTAVTWVYDNSKHKGNVQYVLVTLAIAYTEKGACLSMKEIARRTGISQATVRRALDALEEDGTIQIIKNGGEKRGNGVTNCYRFPAYEKLQGDTSHHETPHGDTSQADTPAINAVPHVHAGGDAAGEKDLSLRAKEKDKKHPLPALAGKESAPAKREKPSREPTPEGVEWADLITAIGEVFGAFGKEALNYANMFTGRAKKDEWAECRFEVPVTAAELRSWWSWYRLNNPNVKRVKQPPLVYSSITEWRNLIKSRPPQPVSGFDGIERIKPTLLDSNTGMHRTIPESELAKLRPSWKVETVR